MKDFLYKIGQAVGLYSSKPTIDKSEQGPTSPTAPLSVTPSVPTPDSMADFLKSTEQYIEPIKSFYTQNQDTVHYCGAGGLALGALYHSKVARTGLGIAGILLAYTVGSQKLKKLNELEQKNQQEEGDKHSGKRKP